MANKPVITKAELEEAVNEIWQIAQEADGSRCGMQDALDEIQEKCVEVCPEVEDIDEDSDDDDDTDED